MGNSTICNKVSAIILLLLATTKVIAQNYKWYATSHYERFVPSYDEVGPPEYADYYNTDVCYSLGADTLIGGEIWKMFYRNSICQGAIRSSEEQVWFFPCEELAMNFSDSPEAAKPFLLYDFSLEVGDVIYYREDYLPGFMKEGPSSNAYMVVKDVREVYGRKVVDFGHEQWIEGVGSTYSAFLDRWYLRPTDCSYSWENVYQAVIDGATIYFNGEIANPNHLSGLESGILWTEQKMYDDVADKVIRTVALGEEQRPGMFKLDCDEQGVQLPFTHFQTINDKIYGIGRVYGNIYLCYDFSLKVGDEVKLLNHYFVGDSLPDFKYATCYVSKVDTAEYCGVQRKRITLSGDYEDMWVEGIGSLTRLFPIDGIIGCHSVVAVHSEINSCTNNGNYLYRKNETNVRVPRNQDISGSCYDLIGRPVATPTRGIYIKDGRKVILK